MEHGPSDALAPRPVNCLDEAVLAEVWNLLATALGGTGSAFALVDVDDGGLRGAAVDSATGQCLIELSDNTVHSASLDRALADHLVRTGKTEMPATAEWARELLALMSQARTLLETSAAAFVMGEENVGLLRITRADVEQALKPASIRAISVARSVCSASPSAVCAVVVMFDQVEWPGLVDEMSEAFGGQLPVLVVPTAPTPVRSGRHSREPLAYTDPLPDPLPEPFPVPVAEPAADAHAAQRRRKQNRLVMASAAAIAAVIVTGGVTAAVGPWREDTAGLESQRYLSEPTGSLGPATTSTSAPVTATTTPTTNRPPPINTEAALAPIVSYTTPPPPPPPTTRRTTQRPRQNTIPNPIPGQPPIVLPRVP